MRVLVVTVVHTPADARIARRQISALLEAGWQVRFAAPWTAFGVEPPAGIAAIDLPRADGRHRLAAFRAARQALRRASDQVDVILLHDPELLLAAWSVRSRTPIVWDVHEDTSAALVDRPWTPVPLRRLIAAVVRWVERRAERRCHLILAEEAYAARFRRPHPIVRNVPPVPEAPPSAPVADRIVQLGRVSRLRGAYELIDLGRQLVRDGVQVEVIGAADPDIREALEVAASRGELVWHGFVPNERALELVDGALVGLSLLHDVPNYRASLPTKVVEYLSRGVPVITTPLPAAQAVVQDHGVGVVVPFGAVADVAEAVRAMRRDGPRRKAMGLRAHRVARERFAWEDESVRFLDALGDAVGARP